MQVQFGTGRGVVREALKILKQKGLLEVRKGVKAGAISPIDYDVTLYYWFYPGAEDDGFEYDYFQAGINLRHTFKDVILSPAITVGYMWSPEY
jgi:DNA-binding FadR family transcriptional regulator